MQGVQQLWSGTDASEGMHPVGSLGKPKLLQNASMLAILLCISLLLAAVWRLLHCSPTRCCCPLGATRSIALQRKLLRLAQVIFYNILQAA